MIDPETERRLQQLEESGEECTQRIDALYQLIGQRAIHEADPTGAAAPAAEPSWLAQVPVRWVVIWGCAVITLVLASVGVINPSLLESAWGFLVKMGAFIGGG